jgi:secretion/DNA translocation related TadE-like protein
VTIDRGSASVWTVGGMAVLLTVTTVFVWFGAAVKTRHHAQSAADLAALAAAGAAITGETAACGLAKWVTDRMGVALSSCTVNGWDARVEVTARPPGVLAGFGSTHARSRAGPVEEVDYSSRAVVSAR